jgi:hypothetical protein
MSLPFRKSFQGLQIVALPAERCFVTKEDLVRVYFQLSEPTPLGWAYIFTSVWRSLAYPMKRQTGVDGDALWIDCVPEEIEPCHWLQLEYAVAQTNAIYQQKAQEQARDQERQKHSQMQLRSKLEELSQSLYPRPTPPVPDGSLIARCYRFLCGERNEPPLLPVGRAVEARTESVRDYHHGRFDGAAVTPDGHTLKLDYIDHDQGGARFCFRYVLSADAAPRLASGFIHEDSRLEYEIPFERIPRHVVHEAQDWLTAQIEAQRGQPSTRRLTELLEHLSEQENALALRRS